MVKVFMGVVLTLFAEMALIVGLAIYQIIKERKR